MKDQSAISPRDLISPYTTIRLSVVAGAPEDTPATTSKVVVVDRTSHASRHPAALIPDVVNTTLIDSSHYKVGHFRGQNTLLLPPSPPPPHQQYPSAAAWIQTTNWLHKLFLSFLRPVSHFGDYHP